MSHSSATMFRSAFKTSHRAYSVTIKKTPTFRDLFQTPVFKTLFLSLVFGSAVVECTRNRKEIEGLQAAYRAKNNVLRDVTQKILERKPVDVVLELNVANSMTRNKYHSVTDVLLDDHFEDFLKMADNDELEFQYEGTQESRVPGDSKHVLLPAVKKDTTKFL